MSLVFSQSASLLAMVVQQWTRSRLRVYQGSKKPLMTARVQTFLSEGLELMPMMAEAAPGLIHVSVFLFFAGLGDVTLNIKTTVSVATVVPIIYLRIRLPSQRSYIINGSPIVLSQPIRTLDLVFPP